MSQRRTLSNRRACETFAFSHSNGVSTLSYVASISRFDDGTIGELFVNSSGKVGNTADVNASDGAVAISLALQYGCPASILRAALKRNDDGSPQGPLGTALDLCNKERS